MARKALLLHASALTKSGGTGLYGISNNNYRFLYNLLLRMGYQVDCLNVETTSTHVNQALVDQYEFVAFAELVQNGSAMLSGPIANILNGTISCVAFVWHLNNSTNHATITTFVGADNEQTTMDYRRWLWRDKVMDYYGGYRSVAVGYESVVTPLVTLQSDPTKMLSWRIQNGAGQGIRYIMGVGAGTNLGYTAFMPALAEAEARGDIIAPPKKLRTYWDCDHICDQTVTLTSLQAAIALWDQYGFKMHLGINTGVGIGQPESSWRLMPANVKAYLKSYRPTSRHQFCVHNHDWNWNKSTAAMNTKQRMDAAYRADVRRSTRAGFWPNKLNSRYDGGGYLHLPGNFYSEDLFKLATGRAGNGYVGADPLNGTARPYGYGIDRIRISGGVLADQIGNHDYPTYGAEQYSHGVRLLPASNQEVSPFNQNQVADSANEITMFAKCNQMWWTMSGIHGHSQYHHLEAYRVDGTHSGVMLRYMAQAGELAEELKAIHEFAFRAEDVRPVYGYMSDWWPDDIDSAIMHIDASDPTTTYSNVGKTSWSDSSNAATVYAVEDQFLENKAVADHIQATAGNRPDVTYVGNKRSLRFQAARPDYLTSPAAMWTEGGDWTLAILLNTASATTQGLIGQYLDANNYWTLKYQGGTTNANLTVVIGGATVQNITISTGSLHTGAWKLLLIEFNRTAGTIKTYVDDVVTPADTDAMSGFPVTLDNGGSWLFGIDKTAAGAGFNGNIQHFYIAAGILTSDEKSNLKSYLTSQ